MLVVNETVAVPLVFVVLVAVAKLPPFVLDHVTTWPASATEFPEPSANCAVMVTAPPAVTLAALVVTRY